MADLPDQEQAEAIHRAIHLNFVHKDHYSFPLECLETGSEERALDLLTNYLLLEGLNRYEFEATARTLQRDILVLSEKVGFKPIYKSHRKKNRKSRKAINSSLYSYLIKSVKSQELRHYTNLELV